MYFMLSRPDCIWCDKAKELMQKKGVDFEVHSIYDHPMTVRLMLRGQLKTAPQIWYNKEYVGGYKDLVNHIEGITWPR